MAFQYLLYRNFVSTKLLNKIKEYSPHNVDFIVKYYKNDWRNSVINNETPISFFKFLDIVSIKNGNVLHAQAYNKNYFDSITKNIEIVKGYSSDKTKVNYRKDELKEIYLNKLKISSSMWQSINDLCDRRNKNPFCHASCNIFSSKKDLTQSITTDIDNINNIVNQIIDKYI